MKKFLSLCNKFKAYYLCSIIRNAKYNTYSKSTQLSAGMFDFYISVKILNKSYKYIYNCNIPSFNDIDCYDYISKLISSLTNGFDLKFQTSGLKAPIPKFNVALPEAKMISVKTEVIQPMVYSSNNGFSLDNHLHLNLHPIIGINPSSFQFKILIGFLIISILIFIGYAFELMLYKLAEISINKLKLYIKSYADNGGYYSSNRGSSSSNAQGYSNKSGTQISGVSGLSAGWTAPGGSGGDDPNDNNNNRKNNREHYKDLVRLDLTFYDLFKESGIGAVELDYILITLRIMARRLEQLTESGSYVLDVDLEAIINFSITSSEDLNYIQELDNALSKRLRENSNNVNRIYYDNPNDAWYYDAIYNDLSLIISNALVLRNLTNYYDRDGLLLHNADGHIRLYDKKKIGRKGVKNTIPILSVMCGNAQRTRDMINRVIIGLEEYLSTLKR